MSEKVISKKEDEKQHVIKSDLFRPKYLHLIKFYLEEGFTYRKISGLLGICEQTLYRWRKEIPEVAQIVKMAKATRDAILVSEAQDALRRRINGYEYNEVQLTKEEILDANGGNKIATKNKQVVTKKRVIEDMAAIKTVLYNKDSKNYKTEQNQSDISEDIEIIVEITDD